ncbi:uncharacterized protein [Euphorbia lathyris]|uniref:uncharacterized protein isoform X2 n=1 Tax=Euphorbia lathyris TaxID=212925 RepID=UPI003314294F
MLAEFSRKEKVANIHGCSAPGIVHVQPVNSSFRYSAPDLKHDTGLAVEWCYDEMCKLEEGLVNNADKPSMIIMMLKEPQKWIKKLTLLMEACVVAVFTRMRKRMGDLLKKDAL